MSQSELAQQLAVLRAAFPQQSIPPETIGLYVTKLGDIEPTLLAAAVNRIIEDSKFFPTIAEIRRMAARLAGLLPPSPAEALAIIRRADISRPVYRRDGSHAYTEHEWDFSHVDAATEDFCLAVIAKVGDPVDLNTNEKHFGWDMGFQKVAEIEANDIATHVLADLSQACLPTRSRRALGAPSLPQDRLSPPETSPGSSEAI